MADKVYVDGLLVTWGERLFYGSVKPRTGPTKPAFRMRRPSAGQGGQGGQGGSAATAQAVRDKLRATVKRVPEVNVKITGSGKHAKQIKNHLDYISRNGEKELEDQDANPIHGKAAVRDLRDSWRDGKHVIPRDSGTVRESFNIMLSMPAGTDRGGVTNAARDFAKEEFGGKYDYVFATHDDKKHPHVHLVVKAVGYDGKRLNPRKADLQRWRETFAGKLRDHGIEANATRKPTRGIEKHAKGRGVVEAKKRERPLPHYRDRDDNPKNPFAEKARETHSKVLQSYTKIAEALAQSPDVEDRKLAAEIVYFVRDMPVEIRARGQSKVRTPEIVRENEKDRGDR